jgi:glycosyltransferase involved in cell wall biosynthesis
MSETPLELTILMPCLNEAETLARCIDKAMSFLQRSGIRGEVVIADNGSTDGSQALAREHGARVVDVPIRGYGAALYAGASAALGTYVIMGDSDDSYDFSKLEFFVENLRKGDDLVMGNRFKGGVMPGAMPFKNRYLGNPVLSGLGRLFFRSPIGDFHCGLRGFSKAAFLKMELKTTGMEFASEMVIKARLLGMKVSEVPTVLHKDGRSRPPHLRPWRDGWRHLRFMLLYSPRWLFLYPGLALGALGLALLVRLWIGPWFILGVGLDVHTMLYAAAMVLLGYQAVLFAAFSRSFAIEEGLLPPSETVLRLFKVINLEVGLVVGVLLTLLGGVATVAAVNAWGQVDFGALDASRTLRLVIPAVLSMVLGLQTILASFFLSMLGLRLRRGETGK